MFELFDETRKDFQMTILAVREEIILSGLLMLEGESQVPSLERRLLNYPKKKLSTGRCIICWKFSFGKDTSHLAKAILSLYEGEEAKAYTRSPKKEKRLWKRLSGCMNT